MRAKTRISSIILLTISRNLAQKRASNQGRECFLESQVSTKIASIEVRVLVKFLIFCLTSQLLLDREVSLPGLMDFRRGKAEQASTQVAAAKNILEGFRNYRVQVASHRMPTAGVAREERIHQNSWHLRTRISSILAKAESVEA
jgi:hypothetical protein